ncbi:MAG: CHAT domain-containing protein [Anaerolineae bacterium]|nr:CHAT domain-containing protein [Anaerolineae bacterium]
MSPQPAFTDRTARAAAQALEALLERWPHLRPPAHAAVLQAVSRLGTALRLANSDLERGNAVHAFLRELDSSPTAQRLPEEILATARRGLVRAVVTVSEAEAAALEELLSRFDPDWQPEPPPLTWAIADPAPAAAPPTPARVTAYLRPAQTLAAVSRRLEERWETLPPTVRAQVAGLLRQVVEDLWYAASEAEATQAINRCLSTLAEIPAVLALVGDLLAIPKESIRGEGQLLALADAASLAYFVATGAAMPKMAPPPEPEVTEIGPPTTPPGASAGAEEPAETFVDLHTRVDFPAEVSIFDEAIPLVVQLTVERPDQTVVDEQVRVGFADVTRPELVTVVLTAEGFVEITRDPTRLIQVYAARDSQPAVFLLRPESPGRKRLTLSFYHKDRLAGVASFETEVKDRPPLNRGTRAALRPLIEEPAVSAAPVPSRTPMGGPAAPAAAPVVAAITLSSSPPEPVDLELRVTTGSSKSQLSYLLHSAKGAVGYHWTPAGSVQLDDEPRRFLERTFDRLSKMARSAADRRPADLDQAYRDELTRIGQNLYDRLFSAELKREYRRIRRLAAQGVVRSLVITSDEPWIPWELVKPYEYDEATGEAIDDDFLCAQFRLSRWLASRGIPDFVRVRATRLVAPGSNLAYVQRERDYFAHELPPGIRPGPLLQTKGEVLDALQSAAAQLFHFACHGDFVYDNPDESALVLRDRETLTPSEVIGPVRAGVARSRPLVFLNACHSGQLGFALTGLGGWAERFVHAGASAFVGTLWEVNDALAAEFAVEFYRRLWQGEPLGHAFYAARLHIRRLDEANPTWLAYTLYADPNARALVGDR